MRIRLSVVVLSLLQAIAPTRAQTLNDPALDQFIEKTLHTWSVPGAVVVVVQGDRVLYLKGFGVRSLDDRQPVTPDTLFPLASCTKAFTATAVALLVDEGKMHWDDPVRKHLGWFRLSDPLADANVTLRDLLTHRTGLGPHEPLWYHAPWGPEEAVRRAGRLPLSHSFRSTFQYQSTMYTAAGLAVAAAAGTSWRDFVQQRLVAPLDMNGVAFTTDEAEKAEWARPHRNDPEGKVVPTAGYRMRYPEPAGSLHASGRHLANWLRFQLGDGTFAGRRLLSAAALAETHTPQMVMRLDDLTKAMNPHTHQMSYGLGWVIQDHRGQLVISHLGAIDGYRAQLTLLPQTRFGIGILANLHATRMNLALTNILIDLLLGLPSQDWNTYYADLSRKLDRQLRERDRQLEERRQRGKPASSPWAAYVGSYVNPAYGTATVRLERQQLVWEWNQFRCPLRHLDGDAFTLADEHLGKQELVFRLGADKNVWGFRLFSVDFEKQ
ncbi:MAG: serine hydrolase [Gemmataceae bacterium]|nr:serine hydrolase [Gemmataceae bacterium]MDW8264774.1 serine hydrolase [Gemmataceae bacterium]